MPPSKSPLRIATSGLGPKVTSLLEAHLEPKTIVDILKAEDGQTFTVRDVRLYEEHLRDLESVQVQALVKSGTDEKRVAAKVQERIVKSLDLMEKIERVAGTILEDFQQARDEWAEGATERLANGSQVRVSYPTAQVGVLLKVVGESRQLIQTLHQDKGVQSFIRNATVNVQQAGVSQRDLFLILREMSRRLDVPLERMMEAYGQAQDEIARRSGPIDTTRAP